MSEMPILRARDFPAQYRQPQRTSLADLGRLYDYAIGAPTRRFIQSSGEGKGLGRTLYDMGRQYFRPPEESPSWTDLAESAGLPRQSLADLTDGRMSGTMSKWTPAGIGGFAGESLFDPANLATMGGAGMAMGAVKYADDLAKIGKKGKKLKDIYITPKTEDVRAYNLDGTLDWLNSGERKGVEAYHDGKRLGWYSDDKSAISSLREDPKYKYKTLEKKDYQKISNLMRKKGYDVRGAKDAEELIDRRLSGSKSLSGDWEDAVNETFGIKKGAKRELTDDELSFVKKEMGTTENWNEAGYINPDGTLLDFSGKADGAMGGERVMDHREIRLPESLGAGNEYSDTMIKYMDSGGIRIDANNGLLNLHESPTKAQRDAIREYARNNDGELILEIGDRAFEREYPSGTKATKILKDIDDFLSGKEPTPLPMRRDY